MHYLLKQKHLEAAETGEQLKAAELADSKIDSKKL
jgi:hypothetical protein